MRSFKHVKQNRPVTLQKTLPSWELTYPFPKAPLNMIFLSPRWDMDLFPRG